MSATRSILKRRQLRSAARNLFSQGGYWTVLTVLMLAVAVPARGATVVVPDQSGLPGPAGWLADLVLERIQGTNELDFFWTNSVSLSGLGSSASSGTDSVSAFDISLEVSGAITNDGDAIISVSGAIHASAGPWQVPVAPIGPVDVSAEDIGLELEMTFDPDASNKVFRLSEFKMNVRMKAGKTVGLSEVGEFLKFPDSVVRKLEDVEEKVDTAEAEVFIIGGVAYGYDFNEEVHEFVVTFGQGVGISVAPVPADVLSVELTGEVDQEVIFKSTGNAFDIILKGSASIELFGEEVAGVEEDRRYNVLSTKNDGANVNFDDDEDGLPNKFETNGLFAANPDSDGDGLGDGNEVLVWKTNPREAHSDGDLLNDGDEKDYFLGLDIEPRADHDGDGLANLLDADSDDDQLLDDEEQTFGTNPIAPDTDGDGFTDYEELTLCSAQVTSGDTNGPNPDPTLKNSDSDGWNDRREYQLLQNLETPSLFAGIEPVVGVEAMMAELEFSIATFPLEPPPEIWRDQLRGFEVTVVLPEPDPGAEAMLAERGVLITLTDPNAEQNVREERLAILIRPNAVVQAQLMALGIELAVPDLQSMERLANLGVVFRIPEFGPCGDHDGDGVYNLRDGKFPPLPPPPLFGDTDHDLLLDQLEETGWVLCGQSTVAVGSSPFSSDTDADGVSDFDEHSWGTNPLVSDTDGDGLLDAEEMLLGTSPCDPDTDDDGVNDFEEVRGWNWAVARISDGTPSYLGADFKVFPVPPTRNLSLALFTYDVGNLYTFPDPYRVMWTSCPTNSDTDGDMVPDGVEKLAVLNPREMDTDGDGEKDPEGWGAILPSFGAPASVLLDVAGLKLANQGRALTDPHQFDTDRDGLHDGEEDLYGTDATKADSDGDLLEDGYEAEFQDANNSSCLNPLSVDSDGDYLSDGFEVRFNVTVSGHKIRRMQPPVAVAGSTNPVSVIGLYPCDPDTDHDGVPDYAEIIQWAVLQPVMLLDRQGLAASPCLDGWMMEGGTVIRFEVRAGALFQDGTPVDASALVFNLSNGLDWAPGMHRAALTDHPMVADVVLEGPLQFRVVLSDPQPGPEAFFETLVELKYVIASPAAIQFYGAAIPFHPVGTGSWLATGFDGEVFAFEALPVPELPALGIEYLFEQGVVMLTWDDGFLESAPSVGGPWDEVIGVESPLQIAVEVGGRMFFRVRGEGLQ